MLDANTSVQCSIEEAAKFYWAASTLARRHLKELSVKQKLILSATVSGLPQDENGGVLPAMVHQLKNFIKGSSDGLWFDPKTKGS